nr:putative ribonuclease H-like domain-containing protein [Tanacetum cinerariifolium]
MDFGRFSFWKESYWQEEGIDYDEVFAPMARIEAIRIFLAFASYIGFIVYQMDVKSAFLYGTIDEEVYVIQPPRFVDPKFPNKVFKVVKALYGLHQAPKDWYATLSTFLERSGYRRRAIDKTLFIKQDKKDIMLVHIYVDDIIFGSTKKSWCDEFKELMKNMFQMSSMGELTFFLRLQVKQKEDDLKPLVKDEEASDVDVHLYRSMIGSLMYLIASRPDIMYLKGQPKLGLWYPKVSSFNLEAYSDSDYAAALIKGRLLEVTTAKQRLLLPSIELASPKQTALGKDESNPLIVDSLLKTIWSSMHHVIKMKHWLFQSKRLLFWSTSKVKTVNDEVMVQALIDGKKVTIKESSIRRTLSALVLKPPPGINLAALWHQQSSVMPQTRSLTSLGQGQDDVSIPTEPSTSKPHKKNKSKKQQPNALKVPSLAPSPEHQLPSPSNDPIHTAKDSLTLPELMDLCIILSNKVLDLESKGRMIADMDEDVKEAQAKAYNLDLQHAKKVLSMQDIDEEEPAEVEEVLEVVKATKLMTEVVTTAQPTTTIAAQVPKPSALRKRRSVFIQNPKETVASVIVHSEVQSKDKEATLLASKVHVVDYQMHHKNNKPYYKIIRVDGTHKLFLSFITLLKNFDREDLEALWKLVKEIFETTELKNFSDDFLLNILKIIFEKPNIEANVWKYQKGKYGLAKVKSWKLFESYRVYVITLTTTQMILLVEKKYPLTHFTLQQMLDNVRLEVKKESEMSLELLRFVQLLIDHQMGDMSHCQDIYDNPSLTKKVIANMKREVGQGQDDVSIPTEPSTSKPHKKNKSKKQQPNALKVPSLAPSPEHQLPSPSNDPIHTAKDSLTLPELMDLCTILSNKVLDLESEGRMIVDMDEDVKEAQAKAYNLNLQHAKKVLSMQDIDEEEPAEMILLVEKKYPLTHFTLQQMLDNVRLEVKKESEMSLELL